ncbi:MAG: hypothetical protein BJ554DRAFT_2221 [Olpidium bornovanus]|uniref:Protein EFR3 n=1 Tax=Olpidium bornovanus TaxID=278681 RepID=A0A8H7ZRE1_9FUNG|nr:MAG: hypothetical protein BJ554DRAFT_2221 [Olpidium bornovanus]
MRCMDRYAKHARLINAVYPAPPETAPCSNELSYLIFYASSRPAKLTKVGAYLEKRCRKDVWYKRKVENQVTLHIIDGLMGACHKDLNLFSKQTIKIISSILDTNDLSLMSQAAHSFVRFSRYHNGSTLGVDAEFTASYEALVARFCDLCQQSSGDLQRDGMHRLIGLRAALGIVVSESLYGSEFAKQMSMLVPAILGNISSPTVCRATSRQILASRPSLSVSSPTLSPAPAGNDLPSPRSIVGSAGSLNGNHELQSIESSADFLKPGHRYSIHSRAVAGFPAGAVAESATTAASAPPAALPQKCPTAEDLNNMSLYTLKKLVRNSGSNVNLVMGPLLEFLDRSQRGWTRSSADFAVSLVRVVATSMQQQWRYLVVTELLSYLDETASLLPGAHPLAPSSEERQQKGKEDAPAAPSEELLVKKAFALVSIIATLLTARISLVGISILELLNNLLEHLMRIVVFANRRANAPPSGTAGQDAGEDSQEVAIKRTREGLVTAIGGLAANLYYVNQVPDIVSHLVSKLGDAHLIAMADSQGSTLVLPELRRAMIDVLHHVFQVNNDEMDGIKRAVKRSKKGGMHRSPISLDLIATGVGLLTDKDQGSFPAVDILRMGLPKNVAPTCSLTYFDLPVEGVRSAYASFITTAMKPLVDLPNPNDRKSGECVTISVQAATEPEKSAKHSRSSGRLYRTFRSALHRSVFDLANAPYASPADYHAILDIFRRLLLGFGDDELPKSIAILLKIQALHRDLDDPAKQRASLSLVLEYLLFVADTFDLAELEDYLMRVRRSSTDCSNGRRLLPNRLSHPRLIFFLSRFQIKAHRLRNGQYSPVFYPQSALKNVPAEASDTLEGLEKAVRPPSAPVASAEPAAADASTGDSGAQSSQGEYFPVGPPHPVASEIAALIDRDPAFAGQDIGDKLQREYSPGDYLRTVPVSSGAGGHHHDGAEHSRADLELGPPSSARQQRIRTSRDLDELRVRQHAIASQAASDVAGRAAGTAAGGNGEPGEAHYDAGDINVDDLRDAFLAAEIAGSDDEHLSSRNSLGSRRASGHGRRGASGGVVSPGSEPSDVDDADADADFRSVGKEDSEVN